MLKVVMGWKRIWAVWWNKKSHWVVLNLWIPAISDTALLRLLSEAYHIHFNAAHLNSVHCKPSHRSFNNCGQVRSVRRRSNLMAGHKWKKMFLVFFVIWCNEKCRKMLKLPAVLRNEKWEQLSLKEKFYYSVGYLSKMFSSDYQYCFYCAQV